MELNNTKIENPEVLIQALITRLETLELELRIAKYRLENVQFILNAEVKVEPQREGEIKTHESVDEVVDTDEEFEVADEQ